jgi:hypothetical protein
MKVKILNPSGWYRDKVDYLFEIEENREYYDIHSNLRFEAKNNGWIYDEDCVITELPVSFCVKKCDDKKKWEKYVNWLKKKYNRVINKHSPFPYYGNDNGQLNAKYLSFGTEIHIDDIIKHIHFYSEPMSVESEEEEFDMTTNVGRLAYAKKHYPIGTKYVYYGTIYTVDKESSHIKGENFIHWQVYNHYSNTWAKIIKEEKVMETQRLSRKGLKEIHSVACTGWKEILEKYGTTNPLEDYIELTQAQVDTMFNSCTKDQLPIVSKYLKQDDGSVDVSHCIGTSEAIHDMFGVRMYGEYNKKAFSLNTHKYDWQLGLDSEGVLCLIPTKKK